MNKIELSVDATYTCPFSCSFCSNENLHALPNMEYATAMQCRSFLSGILEVYDLPCEIAIAGGEPIADVNLEHIIGVFSQLEDCTITICTTGALSKSKDYWIGLKNSGLSRVRLSLHSMDDQICKRLFGNRYKLSVVLKSIENILASNIGIDINFLVTAINVDCLSDVCKLMQDYNLNGIRILGLSKQGNAARNWDTLKIDISESDLLNMKQICADYNVNPVFSGIGNINSCTHADQNGNCTGGRTFFHINTNGDVFGCPASKSIKTHRIGNIYSNLTQGDGSHVLANCPVAV